MSGKHVHIGTWLLTKRMLCNILLMWASLDNLWRVTLGGHMTEMSITEYEEMVRSNLNSLLSRKDMKVELEDNGPNIVHVEVTEPLSGESVETTWSVDRNFKSDFMSGGHIRLAKLILGMLRTRGLINEGL